MTLSQYDDNHAWAKRKVTLLLEQAGCIQHGEFTLASGQQSSVYIDLRLLAAHPHVLSEVARFLDRGTDALPYDLIATIPTAGLPLATALSLQAEKPMAYVRKAAKGYGRSRQVEGAPIEQGARVLLLDDVISTGGSKVEAIEILRERGAEVVAVVVVVDRRSTPGEGFMGVPVLSLLSLADLTGG
jgi:uridine monophosphate synthetase